MNLKLPLKAWPLICAWLVFQYSAQAQSDFRKGYVVTHENDTIRGLVNFHDGIKSSEVCEFKQTSGDATTRYLPSDITGYGFNGNRTFLARAIPVNDKKETVFLELLVQGRMLLMRHRDDFWIEKDGVNLTQISNDNVKRTKKGDTYSVHSNQYIAILNIQMADCSEVQPVISETKFSQKELVELVELYNNCGKNGVIITAADRPWLRTIPGIIGGAQFSTIDISDLDPSFGDKLVQTETEIAPVIGVTLDISAPRITERFLFTVSAWYVASSYYLQGTNPAHTNFAAISIDEIKLPFGVRYTLAPRKVTPFINAGVSPALTVNGDSKWMVEATANNVVTTFDKGELPLRNNQFGFWGGVGTLVRLNEKLDASIEVRYERTDGLVDTSKLRTYTSHTSNFQVVVALRINKAQ